MSVTEIEEANVTIKNFHYDPTKLINVLLSAIQNHADLLKIAGAEMKDEQIQALAYLLITKHQLFKDALKEWNKIPPPKTWERMQEHLRKEYQMQRDIQSKNHH